MPDSLNFCTKCGSPLRKKSRAPIIIISLLLIIVLSAGGVFAGSYFLGKKNIKETDTETTPETMTFGSYPQTLVDEALTAELIKNAPDPTVWISYDYITMENNGSSVLYVRSDFMRYTDLEYKGEKYRGVYFTDYRTNSRMEDHLYFDGGYVTETQYWFKYEPITWQIINQKGSEVTLLALDLLDSQPFQEEYFPYNSEHYTDTDYKSYANTYSASTIRSWLNNFFLETAFSTEEQALLVGSNSYYGDRVWLLSDNEKLLSRYGIGTDASRVKNLSDYALCQGGCRSSQNGHGFWWLNSAYDELSSKAMCIYSSGYIFACSVVDSSIGVAPVICVKK